VRLVPQFAAGAKVSERTDLGASTYARFASDGVGLDERLLADDYVRQHASHIDDRAAGHARSPTKYGARLDDCVGLDLDRRIDSRTVAHRRPADAPLTGDPFVHGSLDSRELVAVVNAGEDGGVEGHGRHPLAGIVRERDDVG